MGNAVARRTKRRRGGRQRLDRPNNERLCRKKPEDFSRRAPRGIGCVAATFTVEPNIPQQYRTGLFAEPGKSFDAIIRFSSSLGPAGDNKKDARGMAIKLFNVPGTKLLYDQPNATTMDLLQINRSIFPAHTTKDFGQIAHLKTDPKSIVKSVRDNPIGFTYELAEVLATSQFNQYNGKSLAEMRFFSMVPYLLKGSQVNTPIKFSSTPCTMVEAMPLDHSEAQLRNDLQARLQKGSLCWSFGLQFYQPNQGFNIEDGMSDWSEKVAPFTKFATITVPQQTFLTDEKLHYCDNLSYHPWHTTAEHRPLGNLNRGRKIIYKMIQEARHKANNEMSRLAEPQDRSEWDHFTNPTYKVWDAITVPQDASN